MKPKIILENNKLRVTNIDSNIKKYSWKFSKLPHFLGYGTTKEIKPKYRVEGYKFWCRGHLKEGGYTDDSNKIVYSNVVEPIVIKGCTDPKATNYNPGATKDDGSCKYPADPDPTFDKAKVLAAVNKVRTEMDIIEAEVNKA